MRASSTISTTSPSRWSPYSGPIHPFGTAWRGPTVPWATANNVNIVCSGPAPLVREITDRYRRGWAAAGHRPEQMPFMGLTRSVVVADTDREAVDIARRAYRCWYRSFILLWEKHGSRPINAFYPDNFDDVQRGGFGIAGAPTTVRDALLAQAREAGNNYLVCRFAFGDLSLAEASRSVDLFGRLVMPALEENQDATNGGRRLPERGMNSSPAA
jgi:alkanesulfonate monooxygenase SsuD/methylene tetrahydromethanopterin reductase-like flavin-dependent oxidoreductase (luciferase family)